MVFKFPSVSFQVLVVTFFLYPQQVLCVLYLLQVNILVWYLLGKLLSKGSYLLFGRWGVWGDVQHHLNVYGVL